MAEYRFVVFQSRGQARYDCVRCTNSSKIEEDGVASATFRQPTAVEPPGTVQLGLWLTF